MLAGVFLVYAASNGILMHTLPLVYPSLIDEFGWDEVQVTLPATVFLVVAALSSPPIGALLDRYSPRLIIGAGAIGMSVGLAAFSQVSELWHMVAVYVVFAFSLSACGLVSTMLVVSRWFDRLRGRATGILLMASSLGASIFPLILGGSMESYGWRGAMLIFAGIAAMMCFVPVLWMIGNRPSEFGLHMDGDSRDGHPAPAAGVTGPTLMAAIRQPRFFLIAFATGVIWLVVISLLQHQSIYLAKDLHLERSVLPRVFSTFFAFSVAGKLIFGWLSDRLDKGYALNASLGVLMSSIIILRFIEGENHVAIFAYAAIAGLGFSGAFTTIQLWIASFYAGHAYGKILAILTLFDSLSGALGTRLVGEIRKSAGSYLPAIDVMIAACIVAMICVAIVRRMGTAGDH